MAEALIARAPESRYRRGTILSMGVYVLAIIAASLARNAGAEPAVMIVLALIPGLAIVGQMLVMMRYLRDADEYLRALHSKRLIAAGMTTLAIFTVWGFLETYVGVQGIVGWLSYCIMWALFGLFSLVIKDSK